jgi:hypothetical protein
MDPAGAERQGSKGEKQVMRMISVNERVLDMSKGKSKSLAQVALLILA